MTTNEGNVYYMETETDEPEHTFQYIRTSNFETKFLLLGALLSLAYPYLICFIYGDTASTIAAAGVCAAGYAGGTILYKYNRDAAEKVRLNLEIAAPESPVNDITDMRLAA